jgi:hypothetical protein
MSLAPSSPKTTLDRTCTIGKAGDQSCNVTDDNLGPDCYESMHAFKKMRTSTSGLRKSPNKWTKEENQKLAALVASYGEKKWKRISAEMGGQKTGAQCAQHWKRVLSPEIRKGHWDENEEDLLLRLVVQYGSCWKKIAKKIPQRTDIQCRYQYLKAKQSREVMWDAKEDESLIKKVMELANCNFFPHRDSSNTTNDSNASNGFNAHTTSLRGSSNTGSPLVNTTSPKLNDILNKENDDGGLSSSGSSEDECNKMKSGECSKNAWTDDKNDVNMSDSSSNSSTDMGTSSWGSSSKIPSSLNDTCANCRNSVGSHVDKVVWLEISEHMARLKLTSTLRTALECKTRFTELLGNKFSFSAPNNFCLNSSTENRETNGNDNSSNKPFGLKQTADIAGGIGNNTFGGNGIGGTDSKSYHINNMSDSNIIGIKFNTKTNTSNIPHTNNNINITNCNNNNITINITNNSFTTANTNGIHFQQIAHCTNTSPTSSLKMEPIPPLLPTPKSSVSHILSPAPSFPSFSHLTASFPHVPQSSPLKPARSINIPSGLESLAAVASILPREMLADYGQC